MKNKNISILLVEDDSAVSEAMDEFLQDLSFKKIYTASDGQQGLELFIEHKPDIVITDLKMPLLDGLEMSKEIKKIDTQTPIILITAQFEKQVTEDATDIGIDSYLFKPISLDRLYKILLRYVKSVSDKRKLLNQHKLLDEYKRAIDVSASVTKTDSQGIITYVNDAFCRMTGYSREELLGKRHNIVRHKNTSKALYTDMWRTITSKKVWKGRI